MADRLADILDLSDQQREQIRAIHESHREETMPMMDALGEARRELENVIHAEPFDEGAIRAAAGQVASIESDLAVRRALIAGETRQVLTPDQAQKAREMRELFTANAGELHGGRRGPWHHHHRFSEDD
jgi:Spy/CpxP family protein refolding chaperone